MKRPLRWLLALLGLLGAGCASPQPALDADRLAVELARRPVILLGEVHDNKLQHQVRAQALKRHFESGARPALAFEQFDRERQADIERARQDKPANGTSLAQYVIDQGRTPRDTWDWDQYRPFIELALQYDVPIVAANLSRSAAGRVAREGTSSVFGDDEQRRLGLDHFEPQLLRAHERIVQAAHCDLLPPSALPGLARAQISRDAVLAASVRPFIAGGVILFTGNGHARRDIGVPRHFPADASQSIWSIGLLEEGSDDAPELYDAVFIAPPQPRDDPCRLVLPPAKKG